MPALAWQYCCQRLIGPLPRSFSGNVLKEYSRYKDRTWPEEDTVVQSGSIWITFELNSLDCLMAHSKRQGVWNVFIFRR